ncbi:MAG TPA: PilZ domain-containing protein [Polyangiaceae bacterium]|nr:PilZ domain-containing protein [Polyangiaceae bacterium]
MSDAVTLARIARESLARGLNALQADPNVPQRLLELAAPIAQAMGALHQIERSGGTQLAPNAPTALAFLQTAVAELQAQPPQYPAVATALEAVAAALGSVHALARAAAPQPVQPAQPAQPAQSVRSAPRPQTAPAAAAPAQRPATAPAAAYPQQPAQRAHSEAVPQQANDASVATAELGAHSSTNFYKGLSGNDIIEHGGLFVSTYKLPKIGQSVRLKVSLPGGYEFEANAVVRWRREPSDAGDSAPPGFGAQFTEITPEARQLVYRYVRNREPLFHDDL